MPTVATIESGLRAALPPALYQHAPALAHAIDEGMTAAPPDSSPIDIIVDPLLAPLLASLAGQSFPIDDLNVAFRAGDSSASTLQNSLIIVVQRRHSTVQIENIAPNYGAQGVFYAPVTINQVGVRRPTSWPVFFIPDNLPTGYVERTEALATLRTALLNRRATAGVIAATALYGLGGVGKTMLARAISEDIAIRNAFPDGILWATLGQITEPSRNQRDWIHVLGGDVIAASSIESGKVELKHLLDTRAMLLILDDVWNATDAQALQVGGSRCAMLITTRNAAQVDWATLVPLEPMQQQESLALLKGTAKGKLTDTALANAIAERLGHLPLALSIVGSLLANGRAWVDIQTALEQGKLKFLKYGQSNALAVIAASVDALSLEEAGRYRELVIFRRGEPLVEAAVARLWYQTAQVEPFEARLLLAALRDRSLIQADYTLHDLQHDYLRAVVSGDAMQRWHHALVDSYGDMAVWSTLLDDDAHYCWRRMAYHMAAGDRVADLRLLLTNGTYLQGKIARYGTAALLTDFALLSGDKDVAQLAGAVRSGAHILEREPRELANQFMGRIGSTTALHSMSLDHDPRFVLESQTLSAPGGPLLRTLAGHLGDVLACAFSPDGRLALSASDDGTLRLWGVDTGQTIHVLADHTKRVRACAFSPDGQQVLSASADATLRLWDVASGQCTHVFEGHTAEVMACAFGPDGHLALSASLDTTLRVWDLDTGTCRHTLAGHTHWVRACAFSPNGQLALSASADMTLRLWDVASGQLAHVLEDHTAGVLACTFSPDGHLALSASADMTLRLWDVASGQLTCVFEGHTSVVSACAFSPDGRLVLSASGDSTLRLWDVASGQTTQILAGHKDDLEGSVEACAFSPDGRLVLSASADATLRLWDVEGGQTIHVLAGHTAGVVACAFSPDGRLVLSASDDGTLRLWDAEGGRPIHVPAGHMKKVKACTFSPDGHLALSASADATLRLWDVEGGQTIYILPGHTDRVEACAFSPDGQLILSASWDRTLRLWNVANGQTTYILAGHTEEVLDCAFSPDGRLILSASYDNTLRLWNVDSGHSTHVLEGHTKRVRACVFSPDGHLALSASDDGTLRLWEVASGRLIHVLIGHMDWVEACAFSPDGHLALSASNDETLQLWGVANGQPNHIFVGHTNAVSACAFSPDGRLILSASYDNTLRLWDVEGGQLVHTLTGHRDGVEACTFSADGHVALSASNDGTLRLWNVAQGQELACWHADTPLSCCAWHPDGRRVIAGDRFGAVHFLRLEDI